MSANDVDVLARGRDHWAISRFASLSLALAILAHGRAVHAQDARVVLATADAELARAVVAALAPWHVQVVAIDDVLGATMPGAADRGRAAAVEHDAAAVVWISVTADGPALWMYDRASDGVVSRRLPRAPPFDDATAAAVALSVKTLLRHSRAAPPSERLEPPAAARAALLRIETGGGARALATAPADVEPRISVALALWPEPGVGAGVALGVRTGSGVAVASPSLAGRVLSLEVFLAGRARWAPITQLDLGLSLEVGASVEILDGEVASPGRPLQQVEVDPVMSLAGELGWRPLDALRIACRVGAQATPRTRTYLVRGDAILETMPVRPVAEIVLEIPIDGGSVASR